MGHLLSIKSTMKSFIALAVVALAIWANAKSDFESCSGFDNTPFVDQFHLSIKPDPLVAKEGETVSIHFDANIVSTLPAGAKVSVKLVKEGVPLPCLSLAGVPIKVGSCDYNAQELLDLIPAEDCKTFAHGKACKLPLGPGFYGDSDPNGAAVLTLPKIPFIIVPLIKGDINIQAKAMDAAGNEILCIQNTLSVTA